MIRINLEKRIGLLEQLGKYILENGSEWQAAVERAFIYNNWFIPDFSRRSAGQQAAAFLQRDILEKTAIQYGIPSERAEPRVTGIVMAGNIPLVGLHDFICVFLSGHRAMIKLSSKDEILFRHLAGQLVAWEAGLSDYIIIESMLKGCDAYIATGSDNSARYFEYYFARYPHIIRRNRTSVAILDGTESPAELRRLADDIHLYFGLGCRNVTKLYVPEGYDFVPLLEAGKAYGFMAEHHKYKNNYDYRLAVMLLNKQFYMTNGVLLLHENPSLFSPISVLNYESYQQAEKLLADLKENPDLQCIVGHGQVAFGEAQDPGMTDFADGVDTLHFLQEL